MGFTLGIVGNYPRALEIQLKALRIAEKHNFLNGKAEVFSRLGNIYRDAGDYSKAVVFHQRARLMFDSLQNHSRSIFILPRHTSLSPKFISRPTSPTPLFFMPKKPLPMPESQICIMKS